MYGLRYFFITLGTLPFFFLGAGVLNNVNELQEILATSSFWEVDVINALQNMFSLVLGGWAKWLFIILAFFVLFSTLLSGTAAFTRTISDYLISMGLVKEKEDTRNNLIKLGCLWNTFPIRVVLLYSSKSINFIAYCGYLGSIRLAYSKYRCAVFNQQVRTCFAAKTFNNNYSLDQFDFTIEYGCLNHL